MEKKKKINYVDNKEFAKAIIAYRKECNKAKRNGQQIPPIPNYIGKCIYLIAENISHKPNFLNYSYRDEMIMDAVENCLKYFHNFNPKRVSKRTGLPVSPFAYFTQIILFAFIRKIANENKQQYIKYKQLEQLNIMDEIGYEVSDDGNNLQSPELYENMMVFIKNFEDRNERKKDAKKKGEDNGKGKRTKSTTVLNK